MGTRRRVCEWWQAGKSEYFCRPAGWRPKDGDIVFTDQGQMIKFARAGRMILKERRQKRYAAASASGNM